MAQAKRFVVDACVLIDYANTELQVLALTSRHVGTVHVAPAVLREVKALTAAKCKRLGLVLASPSLDQLLEASGGGGAISFEDRLCLILARDKGWTCVTNDRRLRAESTSRGVDVLWGLELMVDLVSGGHLKREQAMAIARSIQASNPYHTTDEIVARFEKRVSA